MLEVSRILMKRRSNHTNVAYSYTVREIQKIRQKAIIIQIMSVFVHAVRSEQVSSAHLLCEVSSLAAFGSIRDAAVLPVAERSMISIKIEEKFMFAFTAHSLHICCNACLSESMSTSLKAISPSVTCCATCTSSMVGAVVGAGDGPAP